MSKPRPVVRPWFDDNEDQRPTTKGRSDALAHFEHAPRSRQGEALPSEVVPTPSRARRWTGRGLTGLLAAFLLFDAGAKLLKAQQALEACAKLGWAESTIVSVGALLFACTTLYLVPRTALLGAVLLTGYFGGAISLHVQMHDGAFPIAFAFVFGVVTWVSLYLRARGRAVDEQHKATYWLHFRSDRAT